MDKEEIDKLFKRIELDKSSDSCGFEFADGFSCTFDNIAACYDDRLKLYELVKKQKEAIDKATEKLNNFIGCCKAEKLESGSDYLHHQYWNMFENFNKQIKDILKEVE